MTDNEWDNEDELPSLQEIYNTDNEDDASEQAFDDILKNDERNDD